jgi:hypothetical protein
MTSAIYEYTNVTELRTQGMITYLLIKYDASTDR